MSNGRENQAASGSGKFVKGALILSIAGLLAKVLSAFFRVPLTALIGDEGLGYYGLAYPIYTLFTSIAIVGIPSAIAKLVAEKRVKGHYKGANDIFIHTFKLMLVIGSLMSLALALGAPLLVRVLNWEKEAIYSVWGLSLSPFFVCIMGVYRGYFQGMQDMVPTAVSQVLENAARVAVGLSLAFLFMPDVAKAAGGASFGAVAGGVFGSITLTIMYLRRRKSLTNEVVTAVDNEETLAFGKTAKTVLWIAIPISIGAAVNSIMTMLDSGLVVMRLRASGVDGALATVLYGQLTKVATFVNFPLTFGMALIIGLVPTISEAVARKDQKELIDKIELGTRFGILIAFPASIGLAVLAKPIMALIYPTYPGGGEILAVAAFSIIFVMIGQAFTGMLQGMGKVWAPVYAIGGAAIVKFIANYILIGTSLGVIGAALGSIFGYGVYALINYIILKKESGIKFDVKFVIVKPLVSAITMGLAAYSVSRFLMGILDMTSSLNNAIMTLVSIGAGALVYFIMLVLTGGVTKDDLDQVKNRNN